MPSAESELAIPVIERLQTDALGQAATRIGQNVLFYLKCIQGVTGGTDQTSGGCSLC